VQNIGKGRDTILLKTHLFISHSQSNKPMVHANFTLVFVPPPSFCPWCSYSSCNNQTLASYECNSTYRITVKSNIECISCLNEWSFHINMHVISRL
jgi:hypothetical protein